MDTALGTAPDAGTDPGTARAADRPRVVLHVGTPSSGTGFLASSLRQHRDALREGGLRFPARHDRMLHAALDVRGEHRAHGFRRSEVAGTWDDLARRARAHQGTLVIAHPLLAAASARQVAAARSVLKGLEVHVVVTVRDPRQQALAAWHAGAAAGHWESFEDFGRRVLDGSSETGHARRFRAAHDLTGVLSRWGAGLPAANVHVVVCPPPTSSPEVLWHRFGDAVGFPARSLDPLPPPHALSRARPLPDAALDDLVAVGERWVRDVRRASYAVHGDLHQLIPGAADLRDMTTEGRLSALS